MKKILCTILLFILVLIPVKAANYELKELIPAGVVTTIKGKNYLYKNISYRDGEIVIEKIKNESDKKTPLTISIGLFSNNKRNIGTINLCLDDISFASKEEKLDYHIKVEEKYLGDEYTTDDIKYISVLSGNETCRTSGEHDFLGQTVDEIGMAKNNTLTDSAVLLLNMLKIIVVVLVILFLYKFLFTSAYQNMDGADTRAGYKSLNKELKKEREEELRRNPPKPKEIKKTKTDEVLEQEAKEKENERKDNSDLHNFYK